MVAVAAIGLALPAGSSAAQHHGGKTSRKAPAASAEFMKKAAEGGMAEVQLGNVAVRRAESPDVKQFGQRMVDDHSKANDELKQLAEEKGVALPKDVDAKHKADMDRMSKLSGAEFDRAYMRHMVNDHNEDVALFEREARQTNDPDLKAWIEKTLPVLKDHQQTAVATASKVGAATMHGSASGRTHAATTRTHHQGAASR
jgi:putative membrane protein